MPQGHLVHRGCLVPMRNDLPTFESAGRLKEVEGNGLDACSGQFPDGKAGKLKVTKGRTPEIRQIFPDGRLAGQETVGCRSDTMGGSPLNDLKKIQRRHRVIAGQESGQKRMGGIGSFQTDTA